MVMRPALCNNPPRPCTSIAYNSKAIEADEHFGYAYLGFGHSFAAESEHDQALAAYTTAARLLRGCVCANAIGALTSVAIQRDEGEGAAKVDKGLEQFYSDQSET
jgi:hypothetical protein